MDENLNPDAPNVRSGDEVVPVAPAADPPAVQTSTGGVRTSIAELELARALPESVEGMQYLEAQPAEGTVCIFMDEVESTMGDIERRVMQVVVGLDGVLHKMHLPGFGGEV